jgi:biotin synthase
MTPFSKHLAMNFYHKLESLALTGTQISEDDALKVLISDNVEILPLLQAAFNVRKRHWGQKVHIHILNNVKNGNCPEDCHYCAQGQASDEDVYDYPMKSEKEILDEAENAYKSGAYRYCMVMAGRGPSDKRVEEISGLIKKIKDKYPLQVCVSPGLLKDGQAKKLKEAGLDRLNHNLNSSKDNYEKICTTHSFQDRLDTLDSAKEAGLEMCSGMIAGMGEGPNGIVEMLYKFSELDVPSIPINFLVPVPGAKLGSPEKLTPEYCLRILCLARFTNPRAEIRAAGGREFHLRSMQSMALYPATSIFMDGYLNIKGSKETETLRMIIDAGFEIEFEDKSLDLSEILSEDINSPAMKGQEDLKPQLAGLRN